MVSGTGSGEAPPRYHPFVSISRTGDLSLWAESDVLRESAPEHLYLDLLKKVLTRILFPETFCPVDPPKGTAKRALFLPIKKVLEAGGVQLVRRFRFDRKRREEGLDWPPCGDHATSPISEAVRGGLLHRGRLQHRPRL